MEEGAGNIEEAADVELGMNLIRDHCILTALYKSCQTTDLDMSHHYAGIKHNTYTARVGASYTNY